MNKNGGHKKSCLGTCQRRIRDFTLEVKDVVPGREPTVAGVLMWCGTFTRVGDGNLADMGPALFGFV